VLIVHFSDGGTTPPKIVVARIDVNAPILSPGIKVARSVIVSRTFSSLCR
jgi:hypothetical protein